MTIDGICDHTAGIADDELHDHYTNLISEAGAILYGRKTFELMLYWKEVAANPTGVRSEDDFAVAIENVPKIVFSQTLKSVDWKNSNLALRSLEDEAKELKQRPGKDVFAGSPSMIVQLTNLDLIDEYQLCIHPVIAGKGLHLFKNIQERKILKLLKTKKLESGAVIMYYSNA